MLLRFIFQSAARKISRRTGSQIHISHCHRKHSTNIIIVIRYHSLKYFNGNLLSLPILFLRHYTRWQELGNFGRFACIHIRCFRLMVKQPQNDLSAWSFVFEQLIKKLCSWCSNFLRFKCFTLNYYDFHSRNCKNMQGYYNKIYWNKLYKFNTKKHIKRIYKVRYNKNINRKGQVFIFFCRCCTINLKHRTLIQPTYSWFCSSCYFLVRFIMLFPSSNAWFRDFPYFFLFKLLEFLLSTIRCQKPSFRRTFSTMLNTKRKNLQSTWLAIKYRIQYTPISNFTSISNFIKFASYNQFDSSIVRILSRARV